MKKIIILLIAVIITGCATVEHIDRTSVFYGIDFRKYNDLGFLITPEKYVGDYDAIAIIQYTLTPEANYIEITRSNYGQQTITKKWVVEYLDVQQALDSMYVFCKSLGADAIINFEAERFQVPYTSQMNPVTLNGYELNGLAIKRKAIKIQIE